MGELYSRVGTEDWPESHVRAKTQELIDGAAVWLDSRRLKQVKKLLEEWKRNNPGKKPSKIEIDLLIKKTKDRKAESIARTVEILQQSPELSRLASSGQLPADIWQKLEQRLTADPKLTTALR